MAAETEHKRKKRSKQVDAVKLEVTMTSVVKIYCKFAEPDYSLPWQNRQESESTSSGFAMTVSLCQQSPAVPRIVCNAHGVKHERVVRVRRYGQSHKYVATVEHIDHDSDLALLTVDDKDFWADLELLRLDVLGSGSLPAIGDDVLCVGYPKGGDNISVTRGIVSRIGTSEYEHSRRTRLVVQIDAAINAGNSGGPALHDGRVVGVAFESLDDAENVGYIIPVPVIEHFFESIRRGRCHGSAATPGVHFVWQSIENEAMRRALRVPQSKKHEGVLIVKITTPNKVPAVTDDQTENLQANDVLLALNSVSISCDGTVLLVGDNQRVTFDHLIMSKFVGETVTADVIRSGELLQLRVVLQPVQELVPAHLYNVQPRYLVYGGLVFTTLSVPWLDDCWGERWLHKALPRMTFAALHSEQTSLDEEIVVVSHVYSATVNIGYDNIEQTIVNKADGVPILNLKHLASVIEDSDKNTQSLRLDLAGERHSVVFLNRSEAQVCEYQILRDNNIPAARRL